MDMPTFGTLVASRGYVFFEPSLETEHLCSITRKDGVLVCSFTPGMFANLDEDQALQLIDAVTLPAVPMPEQAGEV